MSYFDYYATTPVRNNAFNLVKDYIAGKYFYANPSSSHTLGQRSKSLLEEIRKYILNQYFTNEHKIIFTSSATEANNLAIHSLLSLIGNFGFIAISSIEHKSLLYIKEIIPKERLISLEVNQYGQIQEDKILEKLKEINAKKILLIIGVVNNEIGTIQEFQPIIKLFKEHCKELFVHLDLVHAFPYIGIEFEKTMINTISLSSHKIGGLPGCGVLVYNRKTKIKPLFLGGGQENGKRAGTENLISIISFYEVLKYIEPILPQEIKKITHLKEKAWMILKQYGAQINGLNPESNARMFNNLNIYFSNVENELMLLLLDQRNIKASAGSACSTGSLQPSYVIDELSTGIDRANHSIRFTFGYKNQDSDIEKLDAALKDIFLNII